MSDRELSKDECSVLFTHQRYDRNLEAYNIPDALVDIARALERIADVMEGKTNAA
jgi:hypothetical protein